MQMKTGKIINKFNPSFILMMVQAWKIQKQFMKIRNQSDCKVLLCQKCLTKIRDQLQPKLLF